MSVLSAIILGAVQGLTEFLPISSDGHLVVVGYFLGNIGGRDALGFDILLHSGSLLAIVVGFRDVWTALLRGLAAREASAWRMAGLIVLATVPGGIAGIALQDVIADDLRTLTAAAVGFLITAGCLIAGEAFGKRWTRVPRMGVGHALMIGIAQAVAILPGVSRSGLTVSMGRALGMRREDALNFSFLMALPIISGAVAKTALDAFDGAVIFPPVGASVAGFLASMFVSLGAIVFLRRFVRGNSIAWFAWYLIPIALLLLAEDGGLRHLFEAAHTREAVRTFGPAAVFLFAFIEVIPPFSFISPGVSALVIAGSMAPDVTSLLSFISAAVVASFLGNLVLYAVGHVSGPSLERAMRISEAHRTRAEAFVRRAGVWAVVGGQFFSVMRPTVAFTAGVLRMPSPRFVLAASTGAFLWGASSLVAGYLLRAHIGLVIAIVVTVGALVFIGAGILAFVEWWQNARRA